MRHERIHAEFIRPIKRAFRPSGRSATAFPAFSSKFHLGVTIEGVDRAEATAESAINGRNGSIRSRASAGLPESRLMVEADHRIEAHFISRQSLRSFGKRHVAERQKRIHRVEAADAGCVLTGNHSRKILAEHFSFSLYRPPFLSIPFEGSPK